MTESRQHVANECRIAFRTDSIREVDRLAAIAGRAGARNVEGKGMPAIKVKHVALLRGINVGGNRKLPMKHLAAMFTEAGCVDAKTYSQTGNVVFRAPSTVAKRLPGTITAAIEQQFGFSVPVVIRSQKELAAGVARNPFLKRGIDTAALHIAFLADIPDPACVTVLDTARSPGDSLILHGRDIYLWLPNGVARTKLTNDYFDRTLKTVSTVRNWNTVLKLLEMAQNR